MTHVELRKLFLNFFVERGHRHVPSSSLVPAEDPTLLFTTAGMVQFKSFYSTTGDLPYRRATTIQKCLRAGGKDSDLENVGHSPRHLTFFEMLGQFSFGDYFKEEAIAMAWEFFGELDVDRSRLWVSVFQEDDDAEEIWKKVGFPADRIVRLGAEDNFWGPAGDTGACGASSEIYYDLGPEAAGGQIGGGPGLDDRYVEVWNSVFPQFDQQPDGSRPELPNRGIDMGSGLERMLLMLQGKTNVFETDLFTPLMDRIRELSGYDGPDEGEALVALRRVADHSRTLAFTLSEGLVPSNVGRGYVLRRILRRAMMSLRTLDVHEPFLYRLPAEVASLMGDFYPELREKQNLVADLVKSEEESFLKTLEQGVGRYREMIEAARASGTAMLPGEEVFRLYSTFGIPWEMTCEMAGEEGFQVDEEAYRNALEADRSLSKGSSQFEGEDPGLQEAEFEKLCDVGDPCFLGYESLEAESRVGEFRLLEEGQAELSLSPSPFYAAAGGQVSDRGVLLLPDGRELEVLEVAQRGERHLHRLRLPKDLKNEDLPSLLSAASLQARVDSGHRQAVARAHTATHLLHAALRDILGEGASQAGSWVGPDRLRLDFNHVRALQEEELDKLESKVNDWILEGLPVKTRLMSRDEALREGATALFGEKYGDEVRVVSVGDVSTELCGGTHLQGSASIGSFLLLGESSVASGIRRIEALTGQEAIRLFASRGKSLVSLSRFFKSAEKEVPAKVEELQARLRKLQKDYENLQARQAAAGSEDILKSRGKVGELELFEGRLEADSPKTVRSMADSLRGKLRDSLAVLLADAGGKLSCLVLVPDTLTDRFHAGNLVKQAAEATGNRGGGNAAMAQAGLSDAEEYDKMLSEITKILEG
ncbi:MAG: alanine--tRNA ligase [Candidatus Krumholzibacteria bacterium]|jgi:alanyl-tRNA synthetase|nr:alanine--tRNA ligase [Candidatus Krumholzibacteria bacterium]MDP6796770.1 alanine--tRNA ligase [Candidatus Krumholzibacteria bacterium]MDP7021676.1 alanine--tRNA ligase [Candidatus Krumholzibacteria bacterium]